MIKNITSVRGLAQFLGVDYGDYLSRVLYRSAKEDNYNVFEITKKRGGSRIIMSPSPFLKKIQKILLGSLEEIYQPLPCVTGHVKGRGAIYNANIHLKKKYILNIDIESFYDTIHFSRIVGMLASSRYGVHRDVAIAIAQICCYDGRLASGASTSGVVSNIVFSPIDSMLLRFAKKYKLTYTRYVDDITFSSNSYKAISFCLDTKFNLQKDFCSGDNIVSPELKSIFDDGGYKLNARKIFFASRRARQQVTGVIVNEKMNVSREFVSSIRGALRSIEKFGLPAAREAYLSVHRKSQFSSDTLDDRLKGQIQYIGQVTKNNSRYIRLAKRANRVLPGWRLPEVIYAPEDSTILVEQEFSQGTAFHIGGGYYVTAAHCFDNTNRIEMYSADGVLGRGSHVFRNDNADYAIYFCDAEWASELPSLSLSTHEPRIGDLVKIYGYPNYAPGSSVTQISASVIARAFRMNFRRYDVNARLEHGASGGPVAHGLGEVIGLVHGGPANDDDESGAAATSSFTPLWGEAEIIREQIHFHTDMRQQEGAVATAPS